ncbi:MAG: GNAT family N-acetyltransferase [Thermoguttaceae bacterium]|nr:GNAT family N-acetyltransferase [Thermoguttaceae bacterium]
MTPGMALSYRYEPTRADRDAVRAIVESTGFFSEEEADVAAELVDERLAKGLASGYEFVFAESDGRMLGYACYGPIPATRESFDLYWIATDKRVQGQGIGRAILAECERLLAERGGGRMYLDTSGRSQYAPTHGFYERNGYRREAVLRDFFAPGDDKVIYLKIIPPA